MINIGTETGRPPLSSVNVFVLLKSNVHKISLDSDDVATWWLLRWFLQSTKRSCTPILSPTKVSYLNASITSSSARADTIISFLLFYVFTCVDAHPSVRDVFSRPTWRWFILFKLWQCQLRELVSMLYENKPTFTETG